jgi:hypothetical protein
MQTLCQLMTVKQEIIQQSLLSNGTLKTHVSMATREHRNEGRNGLERSWKLRPGTVQETRLSDVGSCYQATAVKTSLRTPVRIIVKCKVQSREVCSKSTINLITNPKPIYSHTQSRDIIIINTELLDTYNGNQSRHTRDLTGYWGFG